jgi:hypothetical protein
MKLFFSVEDRQYSKWSFSNIPGGEPLLLPVSLEYPLSTPIFHGDVVEYSVEENNIICVLQSSVQGQDKIPGVLVLEDNKTYGRTQNGKRLLYKCIPDNPKYPIFLVAYDMKPSFSKKAKNKYILFKYDNWSSKHPKGTITETIGDVDLLEAYYEYQLHSHKLNHSIASFTQKTRQLLIENPISKVMESIQYNPAFSFQDYRDKTVFTIDSTNSIDFDDGFSVEYDFESLRTIVTVYIANVYVWIETLDLWKEITERASTIYLPDKKRTMLPRMIETLCSLQQGEHRFAIAVEFRIDTKTGEIIQPVEYKNVVIRVNKNYRYEEPALQKSNEYNSLLNITHVVAASAATNTSLALVENSRDVVAYWMVQTNKQIARYMAREKIGIGRNIPKFEEGRIPFVENQDIEKRETARTFQKWKYNMKGKYVRFDQPHPFYNDYEEPTIDESIYTHFTSPIRRLVDLLNQTVLLKRRTYNESSPKSTEWVEEWMDKIDLLNESATSIRRVQNNCELMCFCHRDPSLLQCHFRGIIFEKLETSQLFMKKYSVFCPQLKLLTHVIVENGELDVGDEAFFKLYLFDNEDKTKKKVRIQYLASIDKE